ncbi:hypothetical protein [Cupriavidus necator]
MPSRFAMATVLSRGQHRQRSTRSVPPTEIGRHFYEQARAAMAQLTQAAESVSKISQELCGELRLLAPMSFGTLWLSPLSPASRSCTRA